MNSGYSAWGGLSIAVFDFVSVKYGGLQVKGGIQSEIRVIGPLRLLRQR